MINVTLVCCSPWSFGSRVSLVLEDCCRKLSEARPECCSLRIEMSHAKLKEKEKSLRKEIVQSYVSKGSAGCSMNTYPMSAESVDEIWILDS